MKKLLLPALMACLFSSVLAQDGTSAPTTLKKLPHNGFVTLKEILSDFRTAPDAAQQKYVGKDLIVYGRVGQLASPNKAGDAVVIYLQDRVSNTPDVRATISMDALPPNTSLEVSGDGSQAKLMDRTRRTEEIDKTQIYVAVEQNIGIKGSCVNFIAGDIILKDCHKVNKARLKELRKKAKREKNQQ